MFAKEFQLRGEESVSGLSPSKLIQHHGFLFHRSKNRNERQPAVAQKVDGRSEQLKTTTATEASFGFEQGCKIWTLLKKS